MFVGHPGHIETEVDKILSPSVINTSVPLLPSVVNSFET